MSATIRNIRQEIWLRSIGYRSVVSVPMLLDGKPIGTIGVSGAKPAMFSERQIAMLKTFADQAVIAIENTRLFTELERATGPPSLEQQTATSEILRVISQSQRDVQPVFDAIAANARTLCVAALPCGLHVRWELINIAAGDGYSPEGARVDPRSYPRDRVVVSPPPAPSDASRGVCTGYS